MISLDNHQTERKTRVPSSICLQGFILCFFAVLLPVILLGFFCSRYVQNIQTENTSEYYETYAANLASIANLHTQNIPRIIELLEDNETIRNQMRSAALISENGNGVSIEDSVREAADLAEAFNLPYVFNDLFKSPEILAVTLFNGKKLEYFYTQSLLETPIEQCSMINQLYLENDFHSGRFIATADNTHSFWIEDYRNIYTNTYYGRVIIEVSMIPDSLGNITDSAYSRYDYVLDLSRYNNTSYCIYNEDSNIIFTSIPAYHGALATDQFAYAAKPLTFGKTSFYADDSWISQTTGLSNGLTLLVYSDSPFTVSTAYILVITIVIVYCIVFSVIAFFFFRRLKKESDDYYRLVQDSPLSDPPVSASCKETDQLYMIIKERIDDIQALQDERQENLLEIEKCKTEIEKGKINILEKQINPHFIFNVLDQINWQAVKDGAMNVSMQIESFSNLLRSNMRYVDQEKIILREELDFTRNYLVFQQHQLQNFQFVFHVDEDILDEYYVPKYILQPIAENSIRHGFEGMTEGGMITVNVWEDSEGLLIQIKDNGCGFDMKAVSASSPPGNGESYLLGNQIALPNIEKRLELIYGMPNLLHADSSPGKGTTITISLPYNQDEPVG